MKWNIRMQARSVVRRQTGTVRVAARPIDVPCRIRVCCSGSVTCPSVSSALPWCISVRVFHSLCACGGFAFSITCLLARVRTVVARRVWIQGLDSVACGSECGIQFNSIQFNRARVIVAVAVGECMWNG